MEQYPPLLPGVWYSSFPIIACGLPRGLCRLPQGPIAACLEFHAGCLEVRVFNFRCFFGPSDRNELYDTSLLSKIRGLGERKFFVVGSLSAKIERLKELERKKGF